MTMRDRILALVLVFVLALGLVACGTDSKTEAPTTPATTGAPVQEDEALGSEDDIATRPVIQDTNPTEPDSTEPSVLPSAPQTTIPDETEPEVTEPPVTQPVVTDPAETVDPTGPPSGNVGVEDSIFG